MMKKFFFLTSLLCLSIYMSAQNLIDIYKKGTVKLIADTEYGQNNDWNTIFSNYHGDKPIGAGKIIKIMPDGSVVVSHRGKSYFKFLPNGTFSKEFWAKNSKGKRFKKAQPIAGIINNNVFYSGLDNMGNSLCFDFDGNYIKTLKMNYMSSSSIALPNGKIAVVGCAIWKTKFRDFVAIVDYETNEQKIIWDHFTDRSEANSHRKLFNYSYLFKERGGFSISTMPYSKSTGRQARPKIACVKKHLIVALSDTGEILKYDLNGKLISRDKITWGNNQISVEEQKEIQRKAIQKYKNIKRPKFAHWVSAEENKNARDQIVKEMEEDLSKIKTPIKIPSFSHMIKDSDDNLLFFEFPKEKNSNKFNVWINEETGKLVCQSSFISDEYDLKIKPSKMAFHNGYIYALQNLKKTEGSPLRLVRFKLTPQ